MKLKVVRPVDKTKNWYSMGVYWGGDAAGFRHFNADQSPTFLYNALNLKEHSMKFAIGYYVATPNPEIYVFIDEEASELPEGAMEIGRETDVEAFVSLLTPYFVLAKEK